MRIESEQKLDFKDVLIRPKRSTLSSREEVNLTRTFNFKKSSENSMNTSESKNSWSGIPIISSNMDTTGTFEIASELYKSSMLTAIHKYYSLEDWLDFSERFPEAMNFVCLSMGISQEDFEKTESIVKTVPGIKFIMIDVANGYTETFVDMVKKVSDSFPNQIIIAGNVCTGEMVEELILAGASIVKCGIGGGCFSGDTRVLMATGVYKNISDIEVGEYVINKNGDAVKVINKINRGIKDVISVRTNNWHTNTIVTPDHKYWTGDLSSSSKKTISRAGKAKLLDQLSKTIPKKSKYRWNNIENVCKNKNESVLLMPNNIKWRLESNFMIDLSVYCERGTISENLITTNNQQDTTFNRFINSCYELGYIFGTFLGDGNSKISIVKQCESASSHWSFGLNEMHIASKLTDCIKKVLNYDCKISKKRENVILVNCYNKCFAKLLYTFSKRTDKHLPEQYYCSDKNYIQGLFDGLIDSDGHIITMPSGNKMYNLYNTSKQLLELFYWCCMNLNISYSTAKEKKSIGGLIGAKIENLKDSYRVTTHTMNRFTNNYIYSEVFKVEDFEPQMVWDIEVDCETHSFIANNSIVHNSGCYTRKQTGVGYPQLSCVIECADSAHGLGGMIISDGGCTCPGDIAKAFGAGADFVMLGGMFSAHKESGGELVEKQETINGVPTVKLYKEFYGMSSKKAMDRHKGGMAEYRSSEGRELLLPYRGPIKNTVQDILGGLRSACTYIGAKNLKEMSKRTTFVMVTQQLNQVYNQFNV